MRLVILIKSINVEMVLNGFVTGILAVCFLFQFSRSLEQLISSDKITVNFDESLENLDYPTITFKLAPDNNNQRTLTGNGTIVDMYQSILSQYHFILFAGNRNRYYLWLKTSGQRTQGPKY